MARSSTVLSNIDSKQSSIQSSGSTTLTRGQDSNPDDSNTISHWNSSKLLLHRPKV